MVKLNRKYSGITCRAKIDRQKVKYYVSRFPPSPNIDNVTVSFDKLNSTYLFFSITRGLYSLKEHTIKSYLLERFSYWLAT